MSAGTTATTARATADWPAVRELTASPYRIPLPHPESDATLAWSATTVVVVSATAGEHTGLGWTYAPAAAAGVVDELLAPVVTGLAASDVARHHLRMRQATRNAPTAGLASLAISAVDVALWDLKARIMAVPLTRLLGQVRSRVPIYGSGGFTSMTDRQLREQLAGWVGDDRAQAVKIKIGEDRGRHLDRDLRRIALAREVIGPDVLLMIDANGGYDTKQALRLIDRAADQDVSWFEEPVSAERLGDLALLRQRIAPEVAAGEYGTTLEYFRRMCQAEAVDCLQVDASRCGGYTGLLAAATVADGFGLAVSTHCAPHLHAPAAGALTNLRHCEWFADHVRADRLLFEGLASVSAGYLLAQVDQPGHGVRLRPDAQRFRV